MRASISTGEHHLSIGLIIKAVGWLARVVAILATIVEMESMENERRCRDAERSAEERW